jgi:hypothetical protein
MSIPMTGLVHPMNVPTNRVRRWLILGLLGGVAMTLAMWAQLMDWGVGPLGLMTDESRRSPDADEDLEFARRSARDEGPAEAASADPADPGSTRAHLALKPVAGMPVRIESLEPRPESPIARALAAIERCQVRYQQVRDYTCTFSKRERIKGQLTPLHLITMKVRTEPRSIYLKFQKPSAGREAIYIAGRHNGKVLAHDVGLNRLLAGTLHLDPNGGRAMEDCRHPISEAGIGPLLKTLETRWASELDPTESVVLFRGDQTVGTRRCTMIETTHPQKLPEFLFYRVRLYIDAELGLPIHFEAYDWPSSPQGTAEMVEEYSYSDLKLNVGLGDMDFDVSNKDYAFGRF